MVIAMVEAIPTRYAFNGDGVVTLSSPAAPAAPAAPAGKERENGFATPMSSVLTGKRA